MVEVVEGDGDGRGKLGFWFWEIERDEVRKRMVLWSLMRGEERKHKVGSCEKTIGVVRLLFYFSFLLSCFWARVRKELRLMVGFLTPSFIFSIFLHLFYTSFDFSSTPTKQYKSNKNPNFIFILSIN